MRPRSPATVAVAFSCLFAFGISIGSAAAADPKPCVATSFAIPAVKAACESGGQAAAKKLMNKAKKAATDRGEEFKCKDCHKDLKGYELVGPDAVTRLKSLLG